jgi:hypothetical protein
MDPDAVVKLILAISVGFSLIVISLQIARVFGGVADLLKDMRRVTQNLGVASDMFLKDYEMIHNFIGSLGKMVEGAAGFLAPFAFFSKMFEKKENKAESQSNDIV